MNEAQRRYLQSPKGKAAHRRAIKKYLNSQPWTRTYRNIQKRCSEKKHPYCIAGIKAQITITELKELWIRDNGHLLKQPSIDRVDPKGNYTKANCRYIEKSLNIPAPGPRGIQRKSLKKIQKAGENPNQPLSYYLRKKYIPAPVVSRW